MNLLPSLSGALVAVGVVMVILYFRPAAPKSPSRHRPTLAQRWSSISKAVRQRLLIGGALGLIVAIFTGFPVMIVVVPAAFVALPFLLGKPSTRERDLILALESWSRSLAGTAETGRFTLKEVIGITRGSVPAVLQAPVDRLYGRMSSTWSAQDALRAFGDDLNSAPADEIVIYLIQAAEFNAVGLSKALNGVAETLSVSAKQMIDIELERAKPQDTMRTMAVIVGIVILGIIAFSGNETLSFYRTPIGGIAMALILAMFVGLLVWARAITRVVPEPRILVPSRRGGATT
ncbi:type II secretion system F family protein [Microbacterium testaceum]|uniref:type II secretion system F family protein n=1 Tax=Microbacterium testaceum TaxID=2033 RepID=UPI002AC5A2E7|nr:hypothetical protein [Microbacterium testaceum]MDZ5146343.1 hypothetical protein [Microbacterium testaceum]